MFSNKDKEVHFNNFSPGRVLSIVVASLLIAFLSSSTLRDTFCLWLGTQTYTEKQLVVVLGIYSWTLNLMGICNVYGALVKFILGNRTFLLKYLCSITFLHWNSIMSLPFDISCFKNSWVFPNNCTNATKCSLSVLWYRYIRLAIFKIDHS